jgi:hypothetical protein
MSFLPVVLVSSITTALLVGTEALMILTGERWIIAVGAALALFHASFIVNTMMQARFAVSDIDRLIRGRKPKRFTPESMAAAIRASQAGGRRAGLATTFMTMATPFFPIAAWSVGEILALNRHEVREHLIKMAERERKPTTESTRTQVREGQGVVLTSKRVVLGQARSVLAAGPA